ncbi:DUF2808 domain-containing protein [Nodosilinea sp. FACHB-141]|uniref:DUF2808 domain-containing protein n=1 Tax=Leptolyngbya subtilissima DQ-A4 TaxID=2933933 RepID=A0ABV0K4B9_9CYAN|nr:DUF2808 domain-containing protein [Nodosilinea sp. FACHB-141]MBD2113518.1 DUF2808 domain-containing protein [Nodosilinea sp. FACHB-141]
MSPSLPWPSFRRGVALAGAGLLTLGSTWGFLVPTSAPAIQYSDGTVGFSYPPRLTESYATRNLVSESNVTYYLTFDFPEAAVEPLDRVVIRLNEGYDPIFRYRLEATEAFANTPNGRVSLPLGELTQDQDSRELTISFDPPAAPGVPITLALRPVRNPRFGGVYLFGATAYPVGETVKSTFMGYARLSFYERDRDRWP